MNSIQRAPFITAPSVNGSSPGLPWDQGTSCESCHLDEDTVILEGLQEGAGVLLSGLRAQYICLLLTLDLVLVSL